jgi:hypothetical protein
VFGLAAILVAAAVKGDVVLTNIIARDHQPFAVKECRVVRTHTQSATGKPVAHLAVETGVVNVSGRAIDRYKIIVILRDKNLDPIGMHDPDATGYLISEHAFALGPDAASRGTITYDGVGDGVAEASCFPVAAHFTDGTTWIDPQAPADARTI